jgi:hypothetical protein
MHRLELTIKPQEQHTGDVDSSHMHMYTYIHTYTHRLELTIKPQEQHTGDVDSPYYQSKKFGQPTVTSCVIPQGCETRKMK